MPTVTTYYIGQASQTQMPANFMGIGGLGSVEFEKKFSAKSHSNSITR